MAVTADAVFKSLADPTRRALLERLYRDGEQTVGALTDLSGVSQPMISKHLAVLKRAGLVSDRPERRWVYYSAAPLGLTPVVNWMRLYGSFWNDRFDRLDSLLRRMDQ